MEKRIEKEEEEHEGYKPNTLLERNIARFSREQEDEWRRGETGERKASERREVQVEEGDSSSTTLYHSSSPTHPLISSERAKQERCRPFHGSLIVLRFPFR